MPGDSGVLVVTRVRSTTTKCTRGRGCNGHPAFPTPSRGREINAHLGRVAPRERDTASGYRRVVSEFVMPGQQREARLRARCPGHPRLAGKQERRGWPGETPPERRTARIGAEGRAAC